MQGCSCDFQFGLCAKLEIAMLFVRATCFFGGHVVVGIFATMLHVMDASCFFRASLGVYYFCFERTKSFTI